MVHLLFPDGTIRGLQGAVSVIVDPSTGITTCTDERGIVLATFARGELLAFSHSPFAPDLIEALQNSATPPCSSRQC